MIGREKEKKELLSILNSGKAELVAVYGRRRVGKTFLIDEVYRNSIVFRHTGLPPIYDGEGKEKSGFKLKRQLEAFRQSLMFYGLAGKNIRRPTTWIEAFSELSLAIKDKYGGRRIVIFMDELPWMDTPKSHFLEAFSFFWNNFCVCSDNIVLVVCGSASSWILDNVIHSKGGLYGRATHIMKVRPFDLRETKEYLSSIDVNYSDYDVANAYMAVGGIPYYLSHFRSGLSLAQNLDNMFFNRNCLLGDEFDELFSSQFANPAKFKSVVELLSKRKSGYTPTEISRLLGMPLNSGLYNMVKALEKGSFVISYVPFGESKGNRKYRLSDPFCLFYLNNVKEHGGTDNYWESNLDSQHLVVWRGLAFENVCFNHIGQIKEKIGIPWMATNEFMLQIMPDGGRRGSQIDMLIERKDNIVNLCEVKFYSSVCKLDKEGYLNLMDKNGNLKRLLKKKQSIMNVLITTFGLAQNEYSSAYSQVITLEDLMK